MRILAIGAVAVGFCGQSALAQFTGYGWSERTFAPSPATATRCLAEETAWITAVGGPAQISTVDFEAMGLTSTPITTINITAGVQMRAINPALGFTISNAAPIQYSGRYITDGFNTTTGGSQHAKFYSVPGFTSRQVLFTFSQPIEAFSMWVTGTGHTGFFGSLPNTELSWRDPQTRTWGVFPTWGPPIDAHVDNALFIGFVAPGKSITSVTLTLRSNSYPEPRDDQGSYSLDDIRWVPSIPSPGSAVALGVGGLAVARGQRRRGR